MVTVVNCIYFLCSTLQYLLERATTKRGVEYCQFRALETSTELGRIT